jgi:hypothetical protein
METNNLLQISLFIILIFAIIIGGIAFSSGFVTATKEQMLPSRFENTVSFYPRNAAWLTVDQNIDIFYVTMGNEMKVVYPHAAYASDLASMSVHSPISQKVHTVIDVLYINGTKERFYEGDL